MLKSNKINLLDSLSRKRRKFYRDCEAFFNCDRIRGLIQDCNYRVWFSFGFLGNFC